MPWNRNLYANFLSAEYFIDATVKTFVSCFGQTTNASYPIAPIEPWPVGPLIIDASGLLWDFSSDPGFNTSAPAAIGDMGLGFQASFSSDFTLIISFIPILQTSILPTVDRGYIFSTFGLPFTGGGLVDNGGFIIDVIPAAEDITVESYLSFSTGGVILVDNQAVPGNNIYQLAMNYRSGGDLTLSINGGPVVTSSPASYTFSASPNVFFGDINGEGSVKRWTRYFGTYLPDIITGQLVPDSLLPTLSTVGTTPPTTIPNQSLGGSRRWMALP